MRIQHRDNIQRQQETADNYATLEQVEAIVDQTIEILEHEMDKRLPQAACPSSARSWLAAILALVNLLSLTAVFWLSLLGYLETRQVIYGAIIFSILALVAYFIGSAKYT